VTARFDDGAHNSADIGRRREADENGEFGRWLLTRGWLKLKLAVVYLGSPKSAHRSDVMYARFFWPHWAASNHLPALALRSEASLGATVEIRDSLRMKAGDRMSFTLLPDGIVLMRVKNKSVSELAGRLYKKGRKAVPIELLSR
jgi:antitoxin PrlF